MILCFIFTLMNLCHPYQGWELGVCERWFSRVSQFFEDPLGRFIWVQFGVMYGADLIGTAIMVE